MSDKVAASMTASIIIDKKEVISSALAAYASAKKEIDGNKLELLIDVSDEQALKRLKEIQKELSGKDYIIKFKNQGIDETLKSLDELFEKLKLITSGKTLGLGKGIGNSVVDEKTLENVLDLFTKVEGHLGQLRKIISDVGDGDEFSPLLKMIKEVKESISELSDSMSKIKLNLNVDLGSTNEEKLNAKISQANHRQLEAYRKLFSSMKASGRTNMQMLKFFEPDGASVSELIGIYRDLIQKIEKEVYGKRNLKAKNIFKEEYKEIENARAAFNRANKSQEEINPLGGLFGGTDLTEVIRQLDLIVTKLGEISSVATEFKNSFNDVFKVTTSVEEIEKLTKRVKELEEELSKLKTTSVETNISPKSEIIESQNKIQEELKETTSQYQELFDLLSKLQKIQERYFLEPTTKYRNVNLFKRNEILKANKYNSAETSAKNIKSAYGEYTRSVSKGKNSDIQNALFNQFGKLIEEYFYEYGKYSTDTLKNQLPKKMHTVIDDIHKDVFSLKDRLEEFKNENVKQYGTTVLQSAYENVKKQIVELGRDVNVKTFTESIGNEEFLFDPEIITISAADEIRKLIPDGYTKWDSFQDLLNSICNVLGIEIPKHAHNATSALEEMIETKKVESSTPIKDTFQGDVESSEMDKVAGATDEAAQAKKDFAIANKGVQDSVDGSKSKLELEADLMESVAESTNKAAKAKDRYKNRSKISEDDYIDKSDYYASIANRQLNDSGYTILGESVNTELLENGLIKVNAKIKAADGTWKSFSAKIDADGNMFEQRFRAITKGIDKLEKDLKNFGLDTKPALTYGETLKKAEEIRSKLNLGEEYSIKVDSNEVVTITKCLSDVESATASVTQTFKSATDAIENFGKEASNSAEKTSVAFKSVKENTKAKTNNDTKTNDDISKQKEDYEKLSRAIERYITVKKRIASGKALSSDNQEAIDLKKTIDELHKVDILSDEQYKNAKNRLDNLKTSLKDIIALTRENTLDSMQSDIDAYNKRYENLNIKPSDENRNVKYQKALDDYKNSIKDLETFLANLKKSSNPITEKTMNKWNELTDKVNEASNALKAFSAAEKGSTEHAREKEIDKLTKYLDANTKISKEARKELERYLTLLKSGDPSVNVQEIHTAWTKVAVAEREAGREGKSFLDIFKDKALYGYAAQLANYYLSLMDFIRYGKAVVNNVIETDTALTELRKVSDASENRLTQNFKTSAQAAKDLGASVSDLISATADWSRMGYSVDDAEELARITTLYKNVGDGIDIEAANASLISTLQGFQLTADDAEGVIDRFNEVSNNFAIDSAGIGEALQRSAASFNAANTDLSKSIALITATNEVVQDPDSVGTLWKTMSARIRGASTELSELGEETDKYTESTSELRDLVMGLTGFDIMLDENTFKDIYEIILGIGKEWKNLTDIEQASLGEALAGKRNANALYAVLGNLDTLEDAYKTAEESAGSAMREQENYEKSIQYSIDKLNASVEEWSNNLVSSDIVKFFVDLLNVIVEISNAITPLGTLAIGGGIFAGVKNVGRDKMLSLIYVLNLPTTISVL